jgi:hypothetical protein
MLLLAGDQHFGVHIASVHQVVSREEIPFRQALLNRADHGAVRRGRQSRLNLRDQVRLVCIARFSQMYFVASPCGGALLAVPRLGIIS